MQKDHGYFITNTFGGTYESASGDFTRKEFFKLIEAVRNAKDKPMAVLIFTMSRFSRTGGNGIALANELVEGLGVNLIEVSTGKNTLTEEGKLEIFSSLIKANQENLDRLKVTIPGMKSLLKAGGWLGNVPLGYDMFGPRVKDRKFYNEKQEIKINATGEKLRFAWQWKLQGLKDFEIIAKLAAMGVKISKQRLSNIWRNPFYCGILINKMLDEPVQGKWEKIVSEEDFWEVQEIIKGNNFGFKHDKANPVRPLNGFICCAECGGKMSGYVVRQKNVHYYKCQTCKGATINAETTIRAKGEGANPLFLNLLKDYQLPATWTALFKAQLKLTYETLNREKSEQEKQLQKELEKCESELKTLKRKSALDEIEKELFQEMKNEIEEKMSEIMQNLHNVAQKVSNQEDYIEKSVKVVANTHKYWALSDLSTKKRIQETIFPDGILFDVKKRAYLTKKVNRLFDVSRALSTDKLGEKKTASEIF